MGRQLFGARKRPIVEEDARAEAKLAASAKATATPSPDGRSASPPVPPKAGSIRIHKLVEDSDLTKLPDDRDLADRILRACNELQEAMDTAVLSGLIVEPNFARIEGRLTRAGVKVDSFACSVKVFRKLA